MNTNDDCRTYVEHLRNEHVHIDRALLELQHLFSQTAESRESDPAAILLEKLKTLRLELQNHFREEDEGGCMEEARSRVPNLSEDVRALEGQHVEFLATLDAMITKAEALAAQAATIQELHATFSDFLHRLHKHEAEENRILLFGFGSSAMETLST
jgi:hypothetical protein